MNFSESLENLKNFDINDLDFNNAGIWPAPVKAVFALLLFALVFGGGYWFFVKDLYAQVDRVEQREMELREQYQ
ncbi:MAG: pilus assembly protein PilP, partial [Oleiphilaceae bacterium]|nr:pilus assembly protein PilP [Oleiphilaceae bacterium]